MQIFIHIILVFVLSYFLFAFFPSSPPPSTGNSDAREEPVSHGAPRMASVKKEQTVEEEEGEKENGEW